MKIVLTKTGIADSLSKFMVLLHPHNVQRFHSNGLVFAQKSVGLLVLEIVSLVGDFFMDLSKLFYGFSSVVRSFQFPAYSPLESFQTAQRCFQEFRVCYFRPGGNDRKVLDPEVYAYSGIL